MRSIFTALAVSILLAAQAQDTLRITMTGDILLDRGVRRVIEWQGIDQLFSPAIDSLFSSSHVVVGNLECPATHIKAPVFKQYIFRGEPEWLADLRRHGITHLNLANNHSIDQGREGLMDTWRNICEAGMIPVGAGRNMQEAVQPVLLSSEPRHVWMLASLQLSLENYAYLPQQSCVSQESMDSLCLRVSRLKHDDPACYVIVSLHWGWENHTEVVPQQRQEARQLIDAGADCLVCHHTHTLQASEEYKGKPVYYSIGNFIFDPQRELNSRGGVVCLTITRNDAKTELKPVMIKHCTPYI